MTTNNHIQQGFVFVNEFGQYASTTTSRDHGPTREIIVWVAAISLADVYPHEAMTRRRFKVLAKCQALKAVATREVLLSSWGEVDEPAPEVKPCTACAACFSSDCNGECMENL